MIVPGSRAKRKLCPEQTVDDADQKSASGKCTATERRLCSDLLEPRFWPAVGTCPVIRQARHVPTATQKKLRDIDLPPANRSRRVSLCVAQTQSTPHSRIPLNAPTNQATRTWRSLKRSSPGFWFFRWVEFGAWQRQKKGPGDKTALRRIKNSGVICCARSRNQNGNPG